MGNQAWILPFPLQIATHEGAGWTFELVEEFTQDG